MPKYIVVLPIVGQVAHVVEAASEEEATRKAFELAIDDGEVEIDTVDHVMQGNLCNHPHWDVTVELDEDEEEEQE